MNSHGGVGGAGMLKTIISFPFCSLLLFFKLEEFRLIFFNVILILAKILPTKKANNSKYPLVL